MAQSKPLRVSKKEIENKVRKGEFILEPELSDTYNAVTYKSSSGQILITNDSGGFIWSSLSDMLSLFEKASQESAVYSIENWIYKIEQLDEISSSSLAILSKELRTEITYSKQSLLKIEEYLNNKKNISRPIFLSVVYFSCELLAQHLDGTITAYKPDGSETYQLIVKDRKMRSYTPYVDLIENLSEGRKCKISEIIELEAQRYKLVKDE